MSLFIRLAIVWGAILAVIAGITLYRRRKQKTAEGITFSFLTGERRNGFRYHMYRFLSRAPFIKTLFRKLQNRVRVLYPSDDMSVNLEVTRIMTSSAIVFALIIVGSVILSRGDIFFICFGVFTAFLIFQSTVTKRLDKAEQLILKQFSEFISGLIPMYREKHGHLDDAIYALLDDAPKLLGLHLSWIYEILTSPNIETEAERYVDYAPNRFLLSFVSTLAVPVKVYGDRTLPDGNTAFLKGLMNLKKEMNEELIKRESIDLAFSSLTVISISAIFMLKPAEWFFMMFMPQTSGFFHGPAGIACMTVIFLMSYAAYTMITSLKTSKREEVKENTIWSRIAAIPAVNEILNIQINKHYTKMMRREKQLRATGDRTGVKAFLVQSAVYAVIVFIVAHIMVFGAQVQSKKNALNDVETTFENVVVPSEVYITEMKSVAVRLANRHKNDIGSLNESMLAQEVRDSSEILKADAYVLPVVRSVTEQVSLYNDVYFRWYYELIIIILSILAFYIPTGFLMFKSHQIQMAKEDEVDSFNLLALIFMEMEGTQVSTLLEWMERFSYSYREAITECISNLEMGEKKALQALYEYDDMFEFRKFVKSLMAVDEVGFQRAFADLQIQQDYYNEKRKIDNQRMISQKSILASRISFIPMYTVIILYLVLPMGLYGWRLFNQLSEAINSMG